MKKAILIGISIVVVFAISISINTVNQKPILPSSPATSHISLTIGSNLKKLPIGSQFLVNVTVHNDGQEPVQFYSGGSGVSVNFDKNVIASRWGGCSGSYSAIYPELQSLMPQQEITFHFPTDPCGAYLANSGGLTNLTAVFRYLSHDIQHTVRVSKTFQIS